MLCSQGELQASSQAQSACSDSQNAGKQSKLVIFPFTSINQSPSPGKWLPLLNNKHLTYRYIMKMNTISVVLKFYKFSLTQLLSSGYLNYFLRFSWFVCHSSISFSIEKEDEILLSVCVIYQFVSVLKKIYHIVEKTLIF